MKEKSPKAVPQKENTPEQDIPSPVNAPVTDAPTTSRTTEPVPVATPVHEANPSQPNVSEEGEIPQPKHKESPARVEPNELVPPSTPQFSAVEHPLQAPVPDKA